jgi:hypothetical protein
MEKVRVTLPDGRVVDGEITVRHKAFNGAPALIIDGAPYSRLDTLIRGLEITPHDSVVDKLLNRFKIYG